MISFNDNAEDPPQSTLSTAGRLHNKKSCLSLPNDVSSGTTMTASAKW